MQVKFKRIDKSLPLPQYATPGSVGLDLYVREDISIEPKSWGILKLNLIMQAPSGTFIGLLPRSSTFKRTGLIIPNSLGVVDQDYCGNEDELLGLVYNTTDLIVKVKREDRLFQAIIFDCEKPEFIEVNESIKENSRGGHGSTGMGKL